MEITNKHKVKLSLFLDRKVRNDSNIDRSEWVYPVKIGVKAPIGKTQVVGLLLPDVTKMTEAEFNVCTNAQGHGKYGLEPFNNTLIKYNQSINGMPRFDFELFKKSLTIKGLQKENDLSEYFNMKMREVNKKKWNASGIYQTVLNSLVSFNDGVIPSFQDLTVDFVSRWDEWNKAKGNRGISEYAKQVRAVMMIAVKDGVITYDSIPFGTNKGGNVQKFALSPSGVDKFFIGLDLINIIESTPLDKYDTKYRDLWLLSFYMGGINFSDLIRLKWSQYNQINSQMSWERNKNLRRSDVMEIVCPVSEPARKIIERYASEDRSSDAYIFNFAPTNNGPHAIDNKVHKMRRRLTSVVRDICEHTGFADYKKVSFKTARNCFASHAREYGFKTEQIQRILGHETVSTTELYLGKLDKTEIDSFRDMMNQISGK